MSALLWPYYRFQRPYARLDDDDNSNNDNDEVMGMVVSRGTGARGKQGVTYSEGDELLFPIFENSRPDVFTIFKTSHTYV